MYRAPRFISLAVSPKIARWGIRPDTVTLAWAVCLVVASAALATGRYAWFLAAAALIVCSYVLDCIDGDIARIVGATSKIGAQLEQISHWVTGGLLLLGAGLGIHAHSPGIRVWVVLVVALIGDYTFHFLYNQLHLAADRDRDYGLLHTITRWLFRIMPIDLNLLALGAITNRLWLALASWAVLANVAWVVVFAIYYRVESRDLGRVPESVETPAPVAPQVLSHD